MFHKQQRHGQFVLMLSDQPTVESCVNVESVLHYAQVA